MSFAHCIIGTENYPDAVIKLKYAEDKFCHGYGKIASCFEHTRKNDIFQPYIAHCVFLITDVNAGGSFNEDPG